jgi:photosystem II stability/assembly factor-like uncharacterized protein
MADEPITSLSVSLWALPGGPNSQPRFLGCHTIGGVTKPKGNNTLVHCPDPVQPRKYKVATKTRSAPGLTTFTIETKMYKLYDFLENLDCPIPIVAQAVDCAPKNEFWNWTRSFIFVNADNVQEGLSNLSSGGDDENPVMMTFDMEADDMIRVSPLRVSRDLDIAETQALNHIFACDQDICAGPCGAANEKCDTLYAVSDAVTGSASNKGTVWVMSNDTWEATDADPFATSEVVISGVCFAIDRSTRRILVFRGTTDVAAPAEAAYSDDGGTTWITVNIGSDNGEFVASAHSVFAINQYNIWVGTDSGRIYFSNDGGGSWTVQENAGIHAGAWNWIQMIDDRNGYAGGAADIIATTSDGGQVWSQANATGGGGDITSGGVIDTNTAWVGTDESELFFTTDAGITWTQRVGWKGSGQAGGRIDDIEFVNNMVGFMSVRDGSAQSELLMTRTGGYGWEVITTPTNAGLNSVIACGLRKVWAVGEPSGGKPVIYKLSPVS